MKITGIIVEYNPFHNGHLYHLQKTKQLTKADYIVAVMSGNFVQRGEPACINKWTRTKMALQAGVDLVLELPVIYATASAETFAWGAIQILQQTGIVNSLCFGSEDGNLNTLKKIAEILYKEPFLFKRELKKNLDQGLNFPKARSNAIQYYIKMTGIKTQSCINDILSSPNNILGIEYLKALLKLNSTMIPYTFSRIANSYHSTDTKGPISSATAIREKILKNHFSILKQTMPSFAYQLIKEEIENKKAPIIYDTFSSILQYILRTLSATDLRSFMEISEGLENRIMTTGSKYFTISEIIENMATKRYTQTRICRELLHIILQIKTSDILKYKQQGGPQYIRILGFRKESQQALSLLKSHCSLPIISNTKKFMQQANPLQKKMLKQEILATDIYTLGYPNSSYRIKGYDYTIPIIIQE